MTRRFATYFDSNYAASGLAMVRSLLEQCPSAHITVLCIDEALAPIVEKQFPERVAAIRIANLDATDPNATSIFAASQGWERLAMIKPLLISHVLAQTTENEQVAFIDADTFFFSSPEPVFDELIKASIVLSPHRFNRETHKLLIYGAFNGGFGIWRNDYEGRRSLRDWWQQCVNWCRNSTEKDGRFMDQGYLTAWPTRYERVHILAHRGANLAPWNVGSHRLECGEGLVTVDGEPLIFYHFSSIIRDEAQRWLTPYSFEAMRQPIVINEIYRPYIQTLEEISQQLQQHGITGLGSVRRFDSDAVALDLTASGSFDPPR